MSDRSNPLDHQSFMGGNRQKWCAILIICMFAIMTVDACVKDFDPSNYLVFLTVIGPAFIIGLTVDANNKIRKAEPPAPEDPAPPGKM